jgi:hypothetical protein
MDTTRINDLIFISNVHKALEHEWFCEFVNKNEFILFNSRESLLYKFITRRGFKGKNYNLKSKFYIPSYVLIFCVNLIIKPKILSTVIYLMLLLIK